MKDSRYKEIMERLGMPNSQSLMVALKQVANEVAQENTRPTPEAIKDINGLQEYEPEASIHRGQLEYIEMRPSKGGGYVKTSDVLAMHKDFEWVGECACGGWKNLQNEQMGLKCPNCNGTGTITRQATMEEVVEVSKKFIGDGIHIEVSSHYIPEANEKLNKAWKEALTVNNGTLRVKESI